MVSVLIQYKSYPKGGAWKVRGIIAGKQLDTGLNLVVWKRNNILFEQVSRDIWVDVYGWGTLQHSEC